ncbi:hypothetical protein [Paenibacillus polymyxa]|uniref:hypothetical protein n=1 Tax=Paenibacillus polymyxa TaxID=1406 RepID=UPI002ED39756|nr:hypothetical protein [Paenibacillus polymyxa]
MKTQELFEYGEYNDLPYAYPIKNRVSGYMIEAERLQDKFHLCLLINLEEKALELKQQEEINYSTSSSLLNSFFVNPAINDYYYSGVDCMVDENKKTDEQLFQEAYDTVDAIDISELDVAGFIKYCEEQYNMTTLNFLAWFEDHENEGNVEMKLWALYAKNLGVDK